MSRTAVFFTSMVVTFAVLGAWLLTESDVLLALGCLTLGLTSLVFAHELSEKRSVHDHSALPEPKSRSGRKVMLQVIGAIFAVAGAVLLVAQVV